MVLINRKKQTDEIRKCARDPVYFFNTYTKIQHPLRGPIHFKTFEFQEECTKDFIDNRFVIVNKARQLGLSTLTAAYVAWLALFHRGKEILIIATKLTTAQNFIKKVKFVIKNLPPWLVLPSITGDNKTTIEFGKPSNSRVQAVPTSPDAGRSEALSLLVVDEAAHIRDMEELWKGLYPTLSCVAAGTKVLSPNGFYDIEEYCKGKSPGEYFFLDGEIYGKNGFEQLSHGYVSPHSKTLKVKTRHGIELEVTPEHPLWALGTSAGARMVKTSELSLGDHLRVQYGMNVFGNDNSLDHPTIKEITPELAYLVGGYIAEGWMTYPKGSDKAYTLWVSNKDNDFRQKYIKNNIVKSFHSQNGTQKLLCCSRELITVFEAIGVNPRWKCDTKRIPKKIWRGSKDIIASFLRGYFDGDGSATCKTVCASSASKGLISDIHQMLLNFGFIPKIVKSDLEKAKKQIGKRFVADNKKPLQSVRQQWGIHIPRSQLQRYYDEIGFGISRKSDLLKGWLLECSNDDRKQHKLPLTQDVKNIIDDVVIKSGKKKAALRALGYRFPEKGNIALSKKKVKPERFRYTSTDRLKEIRDYLVNENLTSLSDVKSFDELCNGNYYWDEIIEITESEGVTYDFTVPKTHSFIQNCILGSNTGGRAILLSTPKGQGNQFHKLCSEAQAGTNEFKYIELPWHVHPERDQEWFDKETKNMERQGIAQELLCDFLASGDTYLHIDEINWVQDRVREPIRREGEGRNLWIWFDPISGPDVKYIISADVASGTGKDYSAFHCINTTTGQVVAEYKGKIRPDLFATLIYKYAVRYNNALVCVERNSYGQHTNTHLITQHNYTHIYFPKQSIPLGSYIPQESIGQAGFDTSPQNRPKVLAKMEEVLRNKQIEVFSSRLYDELKSFVMLNNKPQASRNCHDDLVMSLAIGLWLFDVSGVHSQFAVQLNKSMINAFGSSRNDFENMAGNGREVLPSWSSMVPYMGEQSGGSRSGRQRPKGDDPGNFDWLLWK